jgi:hypothetical protein
MELKQTKVYVPIDVKNLTKEEIKPNPIILFDEGSVRRYWQPKIDEVATHFLKEEELYTFTKEELERVIGDAFDAARIKCVTNDYGTQGFESKEQYIKQILK